MSTERKFQIGDVVCLKSNGTKMTISGFNAEKQRVYCAWVDSYKRPQRGVYSLEMLKHYEPPEPRRSRGFR